MVTPSAVLWFTVMAVQLAAAVLDIDLGVALPALNGAAFLSATYLLIRLLARRLAGDE
jgi:hypothetical protein